MTLNRLVHPASEHAMPAWIRSTASEDVLGVDFATLCDDPRYRNLDRLDPNQKQEGRFLADLQKLQQRIDRGSRVKRRLISVRAPDTGRRRANAKGSDGRWG
jgi:hypothetical protein